MRSRLWLAAGSFLLAQCAAVSPPSQTFSFAALGDTPYDDREESEFVRMIEHMNGERFAFAVHVGDFKAGHDSPCSDELFLRRKAQFARSVHAMVFTPGDNDWTDCGRPSNGGADPLERLARLRALFFADARSLGAEPMTTEVQGACFDGGASACRCGPFVENRRWEHGGVVFATVNMQAGRDREAECRARAAMSWLAQAEEHARSARALVIFTQVNPWDKRPELYAPYVRALAQAAERLRKPVLFVHGDTHRYRVDTPFRDAAGAPLANPLRLEVYGSPAVGWVKVTVDLSRADPFRFEPHLRAVVQR